MKKTDKSNIFNGKTESKTSSLNSDQLILKVKELTQKIEKLEQELKDAQTQKLRALADYQNLQIRSEKEKLEFIKYANEKLLLKILDTKDNLDRAANFINDPGLNMVRDNFVNFLAEFGVKEIEVLGKEFDPHLMECIDKKECETNKVTEVHTKGYFLNDKVLRPAKVIVGN